MLRCQGLGKRRGDRWAVRDVTVEVKGGEVLAVVGPNGCGKSTLLQVLATLLAPTEGKAWVGPFELGRQPWQVRRVVGYVPAHLPLYEDMTVAGHLEFFAACYGVPRSERGPLLDDLLELVDLSDERDWPASRLSDGMRLRLALARALVHSPDLLLVDDAASGLDAGARGEFWELLKELQALGKAIVLAGQARDDLAAVCTHLAVMNGGRFIVSGPVQAVLQRANRTTVLQVRVGAQAERAVAVLKAQPWIGAVSAEGDLVQAAYVGGPAAVAAALQALVREQVAVAAFDSGGPGIEEAVRRLTGAGGVARP
jgi:ABC-2 type transport system ATP-binding protein